MRIKSLCVICFIVVLSSCCIKKEEIQSILVTNCYWDILDKASPHPINSCYKFNENGSCKFYYYHFYDRRRTDSVFLFDDGDNIIPDKWSLIKDSILIRSNTYYVIKYSSDSVFLITPKLDTMVLIKNCTTFNPKDR